MEQNDNFENLSLNNIEILLDQLEIDVINIKSQIDDAQSIIVLHKEEMDFDWLAKAKHANRMKSRKIKTLQRLRKEKREEAKKKDMKIKKAEAEIRKYEKDERRRIHQEQLIKSQKTFPNRMAKKEERAMTFERYFVDIAKKSLDALLFNKIKEAALFRLEI